MCGILGGVFRRPVTDHDVRVFGHAIRALAHRGPDAEAVRAIPAANAVLAFRRLSIIDLVSGDQPMSTETNQHIVFNGEIYNYREERARLAREGVQFRTASDTEVLLRALAREGVGGLERLRGMFGFAYLDIPRRQLILARDRLGIKQVYYAERPEGLFFASEPKALLALPWIHAALAEELLPTYFTFRCVPAPDTLFQGVHKLAPGTSLSYDWTTGHQQVDRYWSLPPIVANGNQVTARDCVDQFEAGFLDAVRHRLVADVPVGAFLSGGLDSSLVVAAMRRLGHPIIRTFTATFPGSPDDESAFAARVSDRFGTEHHERPCAPEEFISSLPRWVELNDDLVADASSLPLLLVSDLARQAGCIVLLCGEGSDELFGGYGSYHKFVALRHLARLVPGEPLRRRVLSILTRAGIVGRQDAPRIHEYFVCQRSYMGTAALLGEPELARLVAPSVTALAVPRARADGIRLVDLGAFDFRRRIPDDVLVRTDRATMGASVEARVPFLDHHLVDLTFRLPPGARALPGISKVVLRRLARRWGVPHQTIVHRKIGFQLPIGAWFRGNLRSLWRTVLAERAVPGIRYDYVSELVRGHESGRGRFEEILWRIVALECWYRRWIEGGPTAAFLTQETSARAAKAMAS